MKIRSRPSSGPMSLACTGQNLTVRNIEIHLPSLLLPPVNPEVSYILDMFEYLTGGPMLCEVVSLMRGGNIGQKYDQCLRSQRAAALRANSVGRCDSLSWLAGSQVTSSQYSTDPSTGECKTQ